MPLKAEKPERLQTRGYFASEEEVVEIQLMETELEIRKMELEILNQRKETQERAFGYLTRVYTGLLVFTAIVIIFQGFNLAGFDLGEELLRALEVATIGEVAGLLALVLDAIFGRGKAKK